MAKTKIIDVNKVQTIADIEWAVSNYQIKKHPDISVLKKTLEEMNEAETSVYSSFTDRCVLIRSCDSGVFFGPVARWAGDIAILSLCHRLFYWDGAATLSQIANDGVYRPKTSKISYPTFFHVVRPVNEMMPISDRAMECLLSIERWKDRDTK